jgi:plasmid stabilization system protein ParE
MKVVWTEYAYAQLDEAMAFIARDRPETAMAWLELILAEGAVSLTFLTAAGSCLRCPGRMSANSSSVPTG